MSVRCTCPQGRLDAWCPDHGVQKSPHKKSPRTPLKRTRGPKQMSQAQIERTAFLRGILAAKLRAQEKLPSFALLGYLCEDCGARFGDFIEALFGFDPGHIIERFNASGYSRTQRKVGIDDPSNIKVQCPRCNKAQNDRRSSPEWTKGDAA